MKRVTRFIKGRFATILLIALSTFIAFQIGPIPPSSILKRTHSALCIYKMAGAVQALPAQVALSMITRSSPIRLVMLRSAPRACGCRMQL